MVTLTKLTKIVNHKKKRLGQGHGSGRGKTAGRGTKGQNARGKVSLTFSAGPLAFVKRLPLIRGKLRNKPFLLKHPIIKLKNLNILPSKTVVNLESLQKYGLIPKNLVNKNIKILGNGELKVSLIVQLPCSKSAKKKIEKAGGKVEPQAYG